MRLKRMIPGFLALSLTVGFAPISFAASVKHFNDLGTNHNWAMKDIMKVSAQKIIEGDTRGNFLPDQAVSQEQALAMIIRSMNLQDEANQYTDSDYNLPYNSVSDWAKKYVYVANANSLIDATEQSSFAGNQAASREWIARLLVRMIGKESDLGGANDSSFADVNTIDSKYVDYVNLAASNKYKLIKGMQNLQGHLVFNPKQPVKRIELAALISRAQKYMDTQYENQYTGEVLSISNNDVLVQTGSGEKRFSIDADTYVFEDDDKVSINALKRFQPVNIIGDGKAQYIEIVGDVNAPSTISGRLVKAYGDINTLVMKDNNGEMMTYTLGENVEYKSRNGEAFSVADLTENDLIELSIRNGQITSIYKLSEQANIADEGIIYDIDLEKGILSITKQNGSLKVYKISSTTTATYPDNLLTGLTGLHKGMKVQISMENDIITQVIVNSIIESGSVQYFAAEQNIVTFEASDGKLKSYKLALADGQVVPELHPGDEITVEVKSNAIVNIEITSQTENTGGTGSYLDGDYIEGIVVGVDANTKTLFLQDSSKAIKSYKFSDDYDLYVNGNSSIDLSKLSKDMTAKLQLFDDEVIYLEADNRVEGTVARIDADRRVISLTLANNEQKTYIIDPDYDIDIKDSSRFDLDDLERNDRVQVTLSDSSKVVNINVEQVIKYKVVDVDEDDEKIRVEDEDEDKYNIYLKSSMRLNVPGVSNPSINDIKESSLIEATYMGYDLKAIKVLPTVLGEVSSVNTANQEIVVKTIAGKTETVKFNANDVLNYQNKDYSNLNNLEVGDRIEVQYTSSGEKQVKVMTKLEEKFYFISDSDYLYVMSGLSNHKLASNVYIHSGSKTITVRELKKNDNIVLYKLNDVVYEIEKE